MAFYHGAIFLERKFTTKVQQTSPGGSLCAFRRACGLQGFSRSLTGYFIYGAAFRRSFNERRLPARLSRTLPRRWHSTEPQNSAKYTTDRVRSLYKRPICEQVLSSIECFIVIFSANSFFFRLFRKSEIVLPNEYAHGLAPRSYINALFMDVFLTGVWIIYLFLCKNKFL